MNAIFKFQVRSHIVSAIGIIDHFLVLSTKPANPQESHEIAIYINYPGAAEKKRP